MAVFTSTVIHAEATHQYPDVNIATEKDVAAYMNKQEFWQKRTPPNIQQQLAKLNRELKGNKFTFAIVGDNYAWAAALKPLLQAAKDSGTVMYVSMGDFLACGVPWIHEVCEERGVKKRKWTAWPATARASDPFFYDTLHLPTLGDHEYGGRLTGYIKDKEAKTLPFRRFWGLKTVNNVWRIKNSLFITMRVRHNSQKEWEWLEQELKKAKADDTIDNVFIFRHDPFYDIGKTGYGVRPNRLIKPDSIIRKFKDYKVKATFGGHQHAYYRTVRDGVTHFGTLAIGASEYGQAYRNKALPGDSFFYVAGRNKKKDTAPPPLPGVKKTADGENIFRCNGKEFNLAKQEVKQLYRNYIMIIQVDGKNVKHWLLHKNGKWKLGVIALTPLPDQSNFPVKNPKP